MAAFRARYGSASIVPDGMNLPSTHGSPIRYVGASIVPSPDVFFGQFKKLLAQSLARLLSRKCQIRPAEVSALKSLNESLKF
jgi:hypothetical protein